MDRTASFALLLASLVMAALGFYIAFGLSSGSARERVAIEEAAFYRAKAESLCGLLGKSIAISDSLGAIARDEALELRRARPGKLQNQSRESSRPLPSTELHLLRRASAAARARADELHPGEMPAAPDTLTE